MDKKDSEVKIYGMPPGLSEILEKLVFLGMMQEGHKPCMSQMRFVKAKSWFGAAYRTWYGESSATSMRDIKQAATPAIRALNDYRDTEYLPVILDKLELAHQGISTLIPTYGEEDDKWMVSQVTVFADSIRIEINRYRQNFAGKKNAV